MKKLLALTSCALLLCLSTVLAQAKPVASRREHILEDALLHQYTNQILDHIQSRDYCAKVLDIKEFISKTGAVEQSFQTVVGVVSKDGKGRWEYLRMTIVDDVMGVRVTNLNRTSDITKQAAMKLCGDKHLLNHYPLRSHFPPRYVNEPVTAAESVPIRFIDLINQKQYDKALLLMSPNLRQAYSGPAGREWLTNVKHITLIKLKDITTIKPVNYYLKRHYAIKAYGAVIDKAVYNPGLLSSCPGSIGLQVVNAGI